MSAPETKGGGTPKNAWKRIAGLLMPSSETLPKEQRSSSSGLTNFEKESVVIRGKKKNLKEWIEILDEIGVVLAYNGTEVRSLVNCVTPPSVDNNTLEIVVDSGSIVEGTKILILQLSEKLLNLIK